MPVLTLLLALLAPVVPAVDPVAHASAVLHAWDAQRASAWARQDPSSLRSLYVPGSATGAADVALLRRYAERGLVVRRIRTQYLALVVEHADGRTLRLRVRDRLAGAVVVDRDGRRSLRQTSASTHAVVLQRYDGRWRVVSVTG